MSKTIDVHMTLTPPELDVVIATLEGRTKKIGEGDIRGMDAGTALEKFRDVERKANA